MRHQLLLPRPKAAISQFILALGAAILLTCSMPLHAEKPSFFYNKGRAAESRQDYEAAYQFYEQAYQQKPNDIAYRAAVTRMRVFASAQHVHRGQQMRAQGQLESALAEFKKAAEIDPASFIAEQEARRTKVMIAAAKAAATAIPSESKAAEIEAIPSSPIELQPLSYDPISLNMTEDAKAIYQILGRLAGINVLVDPEYQSRKIHVELRGVTLNEALSLLALQSKTYWQAMTSNTIFVTADTAAKRKDLEPSILKTFYLSNMSQPSDLQEVVNVLRTILEVAHMTALPSQGAILVRGTLDQVTLAGKLIDDLDKARPEVIVEVAIMQVNRERIRNLGVVLPTSATIAMTSTPSSGIGGGASGPSGTITLNDLPNLNASNFSITIPSATANFLASQSDANLIENPQIRALDGQRASLKIGERVPVAVGSFTAGTTATSALVNTQFQYIDVGVNIDITPTVHGADEVTLKVSLDVSAVDSQVSIGGIQQPVIGQRRIEHTIRLKEGEVNLLGGLLEDTATKSLSGWPGLMNVPILKYLFGNENTDHRQTETVFVLTPHIIRIQEVNPLNLKQLDIGTASNIELRRTKATKPAKPNTEAPNTPGSTTQPSSAPTSQPQAPAPQANAESANPQKTTAQTAPKGAIFGFTPAQVAAPIGQTFKVDLGVRNAEELVSIPLRLQYDPAMLEFVEVEDGGFLGQDGKRVEFAHQEDANAGTIQATVTRAANSSGVSGQGIVFTLTFKAKTEGDTNVSIIRAGLLDRSDQNIPASGSALSIEIRK